MPHKFNKNQRVSLKGNVGRKGKIENILEPHGGYHFYGVLWDDSSLQVHPEEELQVEANIQTPWDLLKNNSLSDYRDFSIATTLHKVRNTTSNTISTLKASRTLFKPYQYVPLVKFLQSDIKKILIADQVGLGKTIEAGHIMLELAARGNLKNALVICSNSLCDKWKDELQNKFNFIMKKYDKVKDFIRDIEDEVAASKQSIFGIISYPKSRNKQLQEILENVHYKFDLLICDEAHNIRNSGTQQHKGVQKIVDISESVVFLTATPIMTDIRNMHSLVRVLDPEVFDSFDIFNNAISQNRPFIKALSRLNANEPLTDIAEELHSEYVTQEMTADEEIFHTEKVKIGELFQNDALYLRARDNMLKGEDNIANRIGVRQDLIELNSLNYLYTRTRRRDIMKKEEIIIREPKTIPVTLSEIELGMYNSVIKEYGTPDNLGLIQRKRQISSCISAFKTSRATLESGSYNQGTPDSKFDAFRTILDQVVAQKGNKLIVFAFFTNTLLYLRIKLKELNIESEIIYGGVDVDDRTNRIERFRDDSNIKVLLSSEVGSEGLDLQFCDAIVNYDLPWNPMVIEQRIGRIDRVGQKSKIIHIYNLVITGTIEERIYDRLYKRFELFKESLGDLEEILGESEPLSERIKKGIDSLYSQDLTEIQQNEIFSHLNMSFEQEKQTLNRVNAELQSAFANDIHFQNEIDRITKNNRYLTKEEIIKYLKSILRLELGSINLNEINENESNLVSTPNNTKLLFDFIEKYKDIPKDNPELENLYRKFKAKHYSSRIIPLTFDQQYANEHKTLEYISAFHPLINAITNYFFEKGFDKNQACKVALKHECISMGTGINSPGYYIIAVYRITITKNFGDGILKEYHYLRTAMADINGNNIKILENEKGEYVFGQVEINGEQMFEQIQFNDEIINKIMNPLSMVMFQEQEKLKNEEELKFHSSIRRRTEQEVNFIEKRIEREEASNRPENIRRSNIEKLKERKRKLHFHQENANLKVNNSLISVNLLQIL